jgi:GAF domain-containing protein
MAAIEIVTTTLVELADNLVDDFDVVDLLSLLTERCVEAFSVHDAGLMLAVPVGGALQVMVSTSSAMRSLELYELQASDGPCLDAYRHGDPVRNEDLTATGARWPMFSPAALDAGFRMVSALPMRLRGVTIGALNLFRTDVTVIPDADLRAAQAFADVATIAILQHQQAVDSRTLNDQLNHALNSRIIIEQAKGMLAERAGVDMEQAFDRLRHHARHHNQRLAAVAQSFINGTTTLSQLHSQHR